MIEYETRVTTLIVLPEDLPEKPEGWTKRLIIHLNFGEEGGSATYRLKDETGRELPIIYGYDTRKPAVKGFKLDGIEEIMTWAELRAKWPEWLAENKTKEWP